MLFSNPDSTAPRFRIDVAVVVIRIFPTGSYVRSWPSRPGAPEDTDAGRTRRTVGRGAKRVYGCPEDKLLLCEYESSEKLILRGWADDDTERSGSNRL